jgi:hypothetical protein
MIDGKHGITRRWFIQGAAAWAALLAAAGALIACPTETEPSYGWSASPASYRLSDYPGFTKQAGQPFKILQFTDTQMEGDDSEADIQAALGMVSGGIARYQPDLVILTGDNVDKGAAREGLARRLIATLEEAGAPYALVMGNHDSEGSGPSREEMGRIYASGSRSLFTHGPASLHGVGNYGINIVDENNAPIYSLILLDSNDYRSYAQTWAASRGGNYDYIYPDQIDWYEWMVRGVTVAAGRTMEAPVPSLAFFHIPLPEIYEVRAAMRAVDPTAAANAFREDPCPPAENTNMFGRMQELGSTTHIFFGHDHINMLDYAYEGIHFVYGLKTGPCDYHDADRMGATLITIGDGGAVTVDFKHCSIGAGGVLTWAS